MIIQLPKIGLRFTHIKFKGITKNFFAFIFLWLVFFSTESFAQNRNSLWCFGQWNKQRSNVLMEELEKLIPN